MSDIEFLLLACFAGTWVVMTILTVASWIWRASKSPKVREISTATLRTSTPAVSPEQVNGLNKRLCRIENVMDTQSVRVLQVSPAEFQGQFGPSPVEMRKAIEDAVRWHYCDQLCLDRAVLPGDVLSALEACIPSDLQRLKAEGGQWARLVREGHAPDTWKEARAMLAAHKDEGNPAP